MTWPRSRPASLEGRSGGAAPHLHPVPFSRHAPDDQARARRRAPPAAAVRRKPEHPHEPRFRLERGCLMSAAPVFRRPSVQSCPTAPPVSAARRARAVEAELAAKVLELLQEVERRLDASDRPTKRLAELDRRVATICQQLYIDREWAGERRPGVFAMLDALERQLSELGGRVAELERDVAQLLIATGGAR